MYDSELEMIIGWLQINESDRTQSGAYTKNQQINQILSRVCAILRRQAFEVVSKHEN